MNEKEKVSMGETYLNLRPLIFNICHSFIEKYGGNYEDVVSSAHEHFIFIYQTNDPNRVELQDDLKWRLYKRLMEDYRNESRRKRILSAVPFVEESVAVEAGPYFDIGEFLSALTEDAKDVVKLVFNLQPDVELEIVQRGERNPTNIRMAIKTYLKDIAWTAARIRNSFFEIREALNGDE